MNVNFESQFNYAELTASWQAPRALGSHLNKFHIHIMCSFFGENALSEAMFFVNQFQFGPITIPITLFCLFIASYFGRSYVSSRSPCPIAWLLLGGADANSQKSSNLTIISHCCERHATENSSICSFCMKFGCMFGVVTAFPLVVAVFLRGKLVSKCVLISLKMVLSELHLTDFLAVI